MATRQRTKNNTKTAKRQPLHLHVTASLVSISQHQYSGKRTHSRHSSHGFLLIFLALTGILLFSNLGVLKAYSASLGGNVSVSVNVIAEPPTVGAVIVFPQTNTETNSSLLEVSGTCPQGTLVSVYNNTVFAGSTICAPANTFSLIITLTPGNNILQAQNYDGLNQPGPITPQKLVVYKQIPTLTSVGTPVVSLPQQLSPILNPITPQPTTVEPSKNPCYDALEKKGKITATSSIPLISISCIFTNIYPNEELTISFIINGGKAPYAVNTDWEDGDDTLVSISNSQIQTIKHTYNNPGTYFITLYTTDSAGNKNQIQTTVIVNGDPLVGTAPVNTFVNDIKKIWVEAPVPLYMAAVTLALGFWIGDIFQRVTSSQPAQKVKKRHA